DGTAMLPAPGTVAVHFDVDGTLMTPASGTVTFTPDPLAYPRRAPPAGVTVDFSTMTQFGGSNTMTAPDQDGFALGSLQSFQLGNDGTIMGVYSNGLRQRLGRPALASLT